MRRRASPMSPAPAAIGQLGLLPRSLQGGIVTLTSGWQRAVLDVSPVNVGLLSEGVAAALQEGYLAVLAGLTFPVQIVARTQRADAAGYLASLRPQLAQETNPHMIRLLLAHRAHVERAVATQAPLERRFYMVVPTPDPAPRRCSWLPGRRAEQGPAGHPGQDAGTVLAERCAVLCAGLEALGLRTRRLGAGDLADLLYRCLCPRLARLQPLPRHALDALDRPIVTAQRTQRQGQGGRHDRPVA